MVCVDLYKIDDLNINWASRDFESIEANNTYWKKECLYGDFVDSGRCDSIINTFVKDNNITRAKWTNSNYYFVALDKQQLSKFLDEVYDEQWQYARKEYSANWLTEANKLKDFCYGLPNGDYIIRFDYED